MGKLNDCFSQPAKMLTLNEAVSQDQSDIKNKLREKWKEVNQK